MSTKEAAPKAAKTVSRSKARDSKTSASSSAAAAKEGAPPSPAKLVKTASSLRQTPAKAYKVPAGPASAMHVEATPADLVDTQLAKYRSMRDFHLTAEPSGTEPPESAKATAYPVPNRPRSSTKGLPFVIQKHAASHLHYDFRLGWSGVLKSWAVAKGPSYVVADRRLAVQVEDHPIEYGGFEGIIPKGQYGGGTVMVWDQGTWWPQPGHENVDAGLRTGSLKFELHGTKLQGKWTLIRMHTTRPYTGPDGSQTGRWKNNDKPQWLLIKEHDPLERPASAPPITEGAPDSALTGRTMDEIARQSDHVWNSKDTANANGTAWYRQDVPENAAFQPATEGAPSSAAKPAKVGSTLSGPPRDAIADDTPAPRITPRPRAVATPGPKPSTTALPPLVLDALDDLPREPQPEFIQPQLAQEAESPPEGPGWLHELKLDGYRMQARKSASGVQMLTRSGLDWTYRVPAIADAVAQLSVASVTLDGEVVVLAEDGTTNFADLQASFQLAEQHPLTFFCFDLLHLEGRSPRSLPLTQRKALLAQLIPNDETAMVRLSEHIEASGRLFFEQACKHRAEGIISKHADEPYAAGRRPSWLKSKCLHEQEFVIGGFILSSDGPDRIGSLLLGYYPPPGSGVKHAGKLIYAGRTGTGFTQKQRKELRTQLAALETKSHAYAQLPAEARRDHPLWVRPELVAQVRFANWTAEDFVRQAAFLGLREDKSPTDVFREDAAKPPQPKSSNRSSNTPIPNSPSSATEPNSAASRSGQSNVTSAGASGLAIQAQAEAADHPKNATAKPPQPASPPIRLTHPRKILDPESQLTKQQLADYYWAVAPRMLPHIADRPLSLVRCPNGAGKPCFYQKHVNSMLPPGIGSVMVADKKGGTPEPYITLSTPEALAGLAQIGVLEIHPWSSGNAELECPDRLIFDLDPDESLPWPTVAEAALEVRSRLQKLGLESFLKTTGGKGLHIIAPIRPEHDFATVKDLAHRFVLAMERANLRLYLSKLNKAARKGKIYLDYLRNERGATAVAPFSPRARSGIPASVPLDWKELTDLARPSFPVSDFAQWQDRLRRDPWKRLSTLQQSLDPAHFQKL